MRVFRDLNFVEQLGTGIQRVLKTYNKEIFEFFPNHIRVTVPFSENKLRDGSLKKETFQELNRLQNSIISLIMDKPNITYEELAILLDVNKRTITRNFKVLLDEKYVERVGNNRNGYWKINKK